MHCDQRRMMTVVLLDCVATFKMKIFAQGRSMIESFAEEGKGWQTL